MPTTCTSTGPPAWVGIAAMILLVLGPTAAFAILATLPRYPRVSDAYTINNGYFPIGPRAGLAVLAAYTAIALGAAMWLVRRRGA